VKERGHAIAETVSCWPPTDVVGVRFQIRSYEICGRQSGTGAGFLQVLLFSVPILIPPIANILWHVHPLLGNDCETDVPTATNLHATLKEPL
jgi:hypothetical protein